jgi:hypothetical protein
MVTVQIKGGIGNQLYQIAAVYSHALTHNIKFVLHYELEFGAMQGKHPKVYKDTFYKNFESVDTPFNIAVREPSFLYKPLPFLGIENDAVYEGYFQSWRYFQNLDRNTLNRIFTFEDTVKEKVDKGLKKIKEKYNVEKIVGVHIRRGDYLRNPQIFNIIKNEWYQKAKDMFPKDTLFLYTTDDLPTVKKEFTFDDRNVLANGSSEMEDLYILTQCDDIIMANSSFSAWGGYLGKEKGKIICPKKWFEYKGPPCNDLKDPKWVQV